MRPPVSAPSAVAPVARSRLVSARNGGLRVATGSVATSLRISSASLPAHNVRSKPPSATERPMLSTSGGASPSTWKPRGAVSSAAGASVKPGRAAPGAGRAPGRGCAGRAGAGGETSCGNSRIGPSWPRVGAAASAISSAPPAAASTRRDGRGRSAITSGPGRSRSTCRSRSTRELVVGQDPLDPRRRWRDLPGHEEHGTAQDEDQEQNQENAVDGGHDLQRRAPRSREVKSLPRARMAALYTGWPPDFQRPVKRPGA